MGILNAAIRVKEYRFAVWAFDGTTFQVYFTFCRAKLVASFDIERLIFWVLQKLIQQGAMGPLLRFRFSTILGYWNVNREETTYARGLLIGRLALQVISVELTDMFHFQARRWSRAMRPFWAVHYGYLQTHGLCYLW
jgi:hypothetical protein